MKVLLFSCSTGGGHNSAAAALAQELEARSVESRTYDALQFLPKSTADLISHGHDFAYRYAPKIYGAGYRREEKHPSSLFYEQSIRGIGPLYEELTGRCDLRPPVPRHDDDGAALQLWRPHPHLLRGHGLHLLSRCGGSAGGRTVHPPPGPDPGVRDRRTAAGAALPHRHPRWAAVPASGEPGGGPPCAESSGGWPHPHAGLRQHGRRTPAYHRSEGSGAHGAGGSAGHHLRQQPPDVSADAERFLPPCGSGAGIGLPTRCSGICTPRTCC